MSEMDFKNLDQNDQSLSDKKDIRTSDRANHIESYKVKKRKPGPKVTIKKKRMTFNIPEHMDEEIDAYCTKYGLKRSELVTRLLQKELKKENLEQGLL